MKMTKKTDPSSQHSSMHGGHDGSKSQEAPTMAGKPKAPASETMSTKPTKSAASNDEHSGHSSTHKTRL
jgi:hypothetical protein